MTLHLNAKFCQKIFHTFSLKLTKVAKIAHLSLAKIAQKKTPQRLMTLHLNTNFRQKIFHACSLKQIKVSKIAQNLLPQRLVLGK